MRLHLHRHPAGNEQSCHSLDESKRQGTIESPLPTRSSSLSSPSRHHRLGLRKPRSSSDAAVEESKTSHSSESHHLGLIHRIQQRSHPHQHAPTPSHKNENHEIVSEHPHPAHWWQHIVRTIDGVFNRHNQNNQRQERKQASAVHVRNGALMYGCHNSEEHYAKSRATVERARNLYGAQGLREIGFEYRLVLCDEHRPQLYDTSVIIEEDEGIDLGQASGITLPTVMSAPDIQHADVTSTASASAFSNDTQLDLPLSIPPPVSASKHCHLCMHRLYHVETDTSIDMENRKRFIADGDMYDAIAKLCQDATHEVMCREAGLEWITIEASVEDDKEPIRALVNVDHPFILQSDREHPAEDDGADDDGVDSIASVKLDRPTLMIATGKGKVRAGVFSRQHLMCTSMESSTALPIVREAISRNLNIVMIDPNVHGERYGYETFRKTMERIFSRWEKDSIAVEVPLQSRDLYILSHSASGAQLARYLLDKSSAYLPHIRAIAFTDSTHNIQWAKKAEHQELYKLLESPEAVYFKCANVRDEDASRWYLHPAGEEVKTDSFWQRRFGNIKTYWAGTNEHSLTNWYAHRKIWEHFDAYLHGSSSVDITIAQPTITNESEK